MGSRINKPLFTNDFFLNVAKTDIVGAKAFSIAGRKDSLSTTILDDITEIPSTTVVTNPGGIQCEVVSDDDNDTLAGTGVQKIEIHYLDTNGAEQSETVNMAGQTPVNTVATDIDHIQWMHAAQVGGNANEVAIGNISLRNTPGTTTYEYISAGGNQSLSARYVVPTGKTAYILGWQVSAITKKIDFRLRATVKKYDRTLLSGIFLFQDAIVLQDAPSGWMKCEVPLECPAGSEIKVSGKSAAAGGDGGAQFVVLLIDN